MKIYVVHGHCDAEGYTVPYDVFLTPEEAADHCKTEWKSDWAELELKDMAVWVVVRGTGGGRTTLAVFKSEKKALEFMRDDDRSKSGELSDILWLESWEVLGD